MDALAVARKLTFKARGCRLDAYRALVEAVAEAFDEHSFMHGGTVFLHALRSGYDADDIEYRSLECNGMHLTAHAGIASVPLEADLECVRLSHIARRTHRAHNWSEQAAHAPFMLKFPLPLCVLCALSHVDHLLSPPLPRPGIRLCTAQEVGVGPSPPLLCLLLT